MSSLPPNKVAGYFVPSSICTDTSCVDRKSITASATASTRYKTPRILANQQKQQRQRAGKLDKSQLNSQAIHACIVIVSSAIWKVYQDDEASVS